MTIINLTNLNQFDTEHSLVARVQVVVKERKHPAYQTKLKKTTVHVEDRQRDICTSFMPRGG